MLEQIHREGDDGSRFIAAAKDKKSGAPAHGFRPSCLQELRSAGEDHQESDATSCWKRSQISDPLLDIARGWSRPP